MDTKVLSDIIIKALQDKKAQDIVRIDVREKTILADYFIICNGTNTTQVRAICENAEEQVEKEGFSTLRREGEREGRWAVVDFGGVILHVFNAESREFYRIERLWGDEGNIEKIEE